MTAPIRIRMYRSGFGDCFLLSFGPEASAHHVLVDFGAHMRGEIGTMDRIMTDIEKTTGSKLSIVVATHQHRDHISGFGQFADRFAEFDIGEVWLPWTDDPKDKDAAALATKNLKLYDALQKHLAGREGAAADAARDAVDNLRGNQKAIAELARGFGTGAKVRYLSAGKTMSRAGGVYGLSVQVLGPPRDKQFLGRMDPPADQRFFAAPGDPESQLVPFPRCMVAPADAPSLDRQPVLAAEDVKALDSAAELPAERLAFALDSARNNTSLVLLLRFKGRSMLFPGDAQWGNWQSWIGTDAARQLLGELDFFKVAHHGSENATPKSVVGDLREKGLAAMCATQDEPFPTIPRMPLLEALNDRCDGDYVVRSDWVKVKGAPATKPPTGIAERFKIKDVWIDCTL